MGHGLCISHLRLKDASAPGLPCIHLKVSSFLYQTVHLKYASHNFKHLPLIYRPLKQTGNLLVCVVSCVALPLHFLDFLDPPCYFCDPVVSFPEFL